jgi:hypothetical protein
MILSDKGAQCGKRLKQLAHIGRKSRIVAVVNRDMRGGDTWVYPVELKRGCTYSIKAKSLARNSRVDCALINDSGKVICRSQGEESVRLTVVPEENGVYKLQVALNQGGQGSRPERITLTIRRAQIIEYRQSMV